MSDDKMKQIKALAREILRLMEEPQPPKDIILHKKKIEPLQEAHIALSEKKENPQNTASGISWSYQGDMVLFKVPYKCKDGFKKIISGESKELAKWDKELKVWKLHKDNVTDSLLEVLTMTHLEWFEQQFEEHKP